MLIFPNQLHNGLLAVRGSLLRWNKRAQCGKSELVALILGVFILLVVCILQVSYLDIFLRENLFVCCKMSEKGGKLLTPLKFSICNFQNTKINYVWFKTHKLL